MKLLIQEVDVADQASLWGQWRAMFHGGGALDADVVARVLARFEEGQRQYAVHYACQLLGQPMTMDDAAFVSYVRAQHEPVAVSLQNQEVLDNVERELDVHFPLAYQSFILSCPDDGMLIGGHRFRPLFELARSVEVRAPYDHHGRVDVVCDEQIWWEDIPTLRRALAQPFELAEEAYPTELLVDIFWSYEDALYFIYNPDNIMSQNLRREYLRQGERLSQSLSVGNVIIADVAGKGVLRLIVSGPDAGTVCFEERLVDGGDGFGVWGVTQRLHGRESWSFDAYLDYISTWGDGFYTRPV